MMLRIGTRGSDLARTQTRLICSLISREQPNIHFEEVIIRTHGDDNPTQSVVDADWPVGGFVGAIEHALAAGEIDMAVHSCKDLPSATTPGLRIVAVPTRGPVNDVLVTNDDCRAMSEDRHGSPRDAAPDLRLPDHVRIGTSSPRRAAQVRQFGDVHVEPIRGNVPTRLEKLRRKEYDGIILAAAGLARLNLSPENAIDLPLDRCLPAPGQGALAVQMRADDERSDLLQAVTDHDSHQAVLAERSLLAGIEGGCATPLGALASIEGNVITLRGQLFDSTGRRQVVDSVCGDDPIAIGRELAQRLLRELARTTEVES